MSENPNKSSFTGQNESSSFTSSKFDLEKKPRVLVLSTRGLHLDVFRSVEYEFEDAICTFEHADMLTLIFASGFDNLVKKKLANFVGLNLGNSKFLESGCSPSILNQEYDLLFFICQNFWDVTCINSIKGWRQKCCKAVLWIDEVWIKEVQERKTQLCLKLLQEFDCIFTTQTSSVEALANVAQRPCHSLPYAVDAIRFCPYPEPPQRTIDVYSIGRRSSIVHKALLEAAEQKDFLYLYDTLNCLKMFEYKEHRTLYINLIKRSRYFIANKAKFDSAEQIGVQEEIGSRFFEGAAGGAVMIGTPPVCEAYARYFNWSDAVIEIPYNATNIASIIAELDKQPERLHKIRKDNVINSLLRHDWVYRWEKILEKVGLDSTPEMLLRRTYLQELAQMVSSV